jgi:hypothetical protein
MEGDEMTPEVELLPSHTRWTGEQDVVLLKMFNAGCTVEEMGVVLKRNRRQIYNRLYNKELRLSDRPGNEPDYPEFDRIMNLRTGETL